MSPKKNPTAPAESPVPKVPAQPKRKSDPAKPPAAKPPAKPKAPPKKKEPAEQPAPKPRVPRVRKTVAPATAPSETPAVSPQSANLRIVMVASEAHPFAKTGGLAEVLGALPVALARLGHDVTVIIPRYRGIAVAEGTSTPHGFSLAGRSVQVAFVEKAIDAGVKAVLVDAPELFDREGLYGASGRDYPDNGWRFAVLSRAALEYVRLKQVRPSIFHVHDWQAGLVPVYQKMHFSNDPYVGGVPSIFTIHNIAFQGVFGTSALPALGLGAEMLDINALEYWGHISFMKGGINFSEKITTVSPTYAHEILTAQYGFGMEGVLRRRSNDLVGILNGIDTERWNPQTDAFAPQFSIDDLGGKRLAKQHLLQTLKLPFHEQALNRPVVGVISRLTNQKGFDLVSAAAGQLMELDAAWAMLGSGDGHYEQLWKTMAARHPEKVSATIGFNERLAHLIEAGADLFLMPSHYEPCGLNQMYSLRYGTVPVVRATGGLQDTVRDVTEDGANGFKFSDYTPGAMVAALRRALDVYRDAGQWTALQRTGMQRDSSWDVSAREYVKVYRSSISEDVNGI